MKSQLEDVLNKVHQGKLSPKEALSILKDFPYQDLGFAKIDHHRELRKGWLLSWQCSILAQVEWGWLISTTALAQDTWQAL